jgi:hypothetical protein
MLQRVPVIHYYEAWNSSKYLKHLICPPLSSAEVKSSGPIPTLSHASPWRRAMYLHFLSSQLWQRRTLIFWERRVILYKFTDISEKSTACLVCLLFEDETSVNLWLTSWHHITQHLPYKDNDLWSQSQKKLRGLSPRANYTDRAIAACQRS